MCKTNYINDPDREACLVAEHKQEIAIREALGAAGERTVAGVEQIYVLIVEPLDLLLDLGGGRLRGRAHIGQEGGRARLYNTRLLLPFGCLLLRVLGIIFTAADHVMKIADHGTHYRLFTFRFEPKKLNKLNSKQKCVINSLDRFGSNSSVIGLLSGELLLLEQMLLLLLMLLQRVGMRRRRILIHNEQRVDTAAAKVGHHAAGAYHDILHGAMIRKVATRWINDAAWRIHVQALAIIFLFKKGERAFKVFVFVLWRFSNIKIHYYLKRHLHTNKNVFFFFFFK